MRSYVQPITCKTALNRTGIPGHRYCLSPYTGCRHGCVYCYAPVVLRYSPVSSRWGSLIQAKVNLPEVLALELRGRRAPIGSVFMGSVTDAYQPCEEELRLTRRCLELLSLRPDAGVSILTKSALVARDADLLARWAERVASASTGSGQGAGPAPEVSVGFTLTTLDEKTARMVEPAAAPPAARLEAAGTLARSGIPVWVFVAPLLPGVGDMPEALEALLCAAQRAGARQVRFDRFNPYPRAVAALRSVYARRFPGALPSLERYLSAPGPYVAAFTEMADALARSVGVEFS